MIRLLFQKNRESICRRYSFASCEKLTDDWYEKYGELLKNIDDNDGRFNVKRSHPTLGDWLHTQRDFKEMMILPEDFYY